MAGLYLHLQHPEIEARDCEDCQRYWYRDDGSIVRNGDGSPRERVKPVICDRCPKVIYAVWTEDNYEIYCNYKIGNTSEIEPRKLLLLKETEDQLTRMLYIADIATLLGGGKK